MNKERFSVYCDLPTMALIDEAAARNHTSRSNIARMFLQLIRYIPVEKLKETSPIPGILGLQIKEDADARD